MPLLAHPRLERVLGATSAMLTSMGQIPSFIGHFIGFGTNLPHVLVRQQLKAFFEIHDERCRPTLHFALPSRAFGASTLATHRAFTSATHGTKMVGGRTLFLYLFFMSVDHVHVLGHGHVLGVVVVDLGQRFGWRCAAQKVVLPHLHTPW